MDKNTFVPKKVESIIFKQSIIISYTLNDDYTPSESIPKTLASDFFEKWCYENDTEYDFEHPLFNLYEPVYEIIPPHFKDEEFSIECIATKNTDWNFVKSPFQNIKHNLIDEITTNPDLLQDTSSTLDSLWMFNHTREYIKTHIDKSVAFVSSDYDFCFAVKKHIPSFNKNDNDGCHVNNTMIDTRNVEIFKMAPKAYQNYPVIQPITGKSFEDLKNKVQEFLDELMGIINRPLINCPHCNGRGVIDKP